MNTVESPVETPRETDEPEIEIWHAFWCLELYGREPRPGDLALCGVVKETNRLGDPTTTPHQPCVVCLDVLRSRRWPSRA